MMHHRLASTWVLSLEVAEHIPRRFEASFVRNVDCANTRGAVISWSSITQKQVRPYKPCQSSPSLAAPRSPPPPA